MISSKKMDSMANSTGNNTVSISDIESQDDGRDAYFSEARSIITDKEKASIGISAADTSKWDLTVLCKDYGSAGGSWCGRTGRGNKTEKSSGHQRGT